MTVRYRLLGPLVAEDERGVIALAGRQQRVALALLLLNANMPVSADTLADRLWPKKNEAPTSPSGALRVLLSQLRRALEGAGPRDAPSALSRGGATGWVLRVDPADIDVTRFEAGVVAGNQAAERGESDTAVARWREALALWAGPALPEVVDELEDARAAATRWQELRIVTLESCIETELELGFHSRLTGELEGLVGENPLHERFVELLMLALYRSGRQAEALRLYTHTRLLLAEEMGIEPGRALKDLELAILDQKPSLDRGSTLAGRQTGALLLTVQPPVGVTPGYVADMPHALVAAAERGHMLGRESALARWREVWARAVAGRTQIVVVSGPAGIGKTRFAAEAAIVGRDDGARVVFGRCDEDALVPYQPIVEALRDHLRQRDPTVALGDLTSVPSELLKLVPELRPLVRESPEPVTALDERYWLFEAVVDLLRALARAQPLVIVIEDFHWADGPSLSLLRHLGRRLIDIPLVLLITCRDSERPRDDPVSPVLADFEREGRLTRIALAGLEPVDALAIVDQVWPEDGWRPSVVARRETCRLAEGNPFFLRQLARHLGEVDDSEVGSVARLPQEIQALLQRRLSRMSEATLGALTTAAVIGREFDVGLLSAVLAADEDHVLEELDEALDAHLIVEGREGTDSFSFVHALLREACYRRVSASRRVRLHSRVGLTLEAAAAPGTLSAIAHHFALAGRDHRAQARTYSRRAGDQAMAVLAFEEAATLYQRALDSMDPNEPPTDRLDVLLAIGRARTRAGDPPGSRQVLAGALDLARKVGAGRHFGEAALAYGGEWGIDRALDDTHIPLLEEAVAVVGQQDAKLLAMLVARLASATFHLRGADAAREHSERALQLAEACGDATALTMALHARHLVLLVDGSPEARLQLAEDQLQAARRAGSEGVNEALWNSVVDLIELGRSDAVDRAARAYEEQTRHSRRPVDLWFTSVLDSAILAHRGDIEGAFRAAEQAVTRGAALGQVDAMRVFSAQVFIVRWLQGRVGELRDATADFLAREPDIVAWRCALALVHGECGDPEAARSVLNPLVGDGFGQIMRDSLWTGTLVLAGEAIAIAEFAELVPPIEDLLRPLSGRHIALGQAVAVLGPVDRVLGQLAATRGELDAAADHLRVAMQLADTAHSPPSRLLAAVAAADVRGRQGDRAKALEVVGIAREEAERLGLGLVTARARAVTDRLTGHT
jgi:DNA-binding SARP family transcriptional activator/tetratricopeptide (TPR) repeat protein